MDKNWIGDIGFISLISWRLSKKILALLARTHKWQKVQDNMEYGWVLHTKTEDNWTWSGSWISEPNDIIESYSGVSKATTSA